MGVDEIQPPAGCKFPRISSNDNRRNGEEEVEGEQPKRRSAADLVGDVGRLYGWPSSRIVRVSRASGGKDRHSKVLTCKGLRDRRVRLSVSTAIQFYDLQDRLGYDQPSKAVEWLLKAAASSIEELPPMDANFPDTPKQLSNGKRSIASAGDELVFDSVEVDMDGDGAGGGGGDPIFRHHNNLTKSSACSSPSETSKGSVLSLSRSENRVKARNRAKGRVAEKEENESSCIVSGLNPISQTTSFTELLSITLNTTHDKNEHTTTTTADGGVSNESRLFQKSSREWSSSSSMDYFTGGPLNPTAATTRVGQMTVAPPLFSLSGEHHPEIQHFSIFPDHLHVPVVSSAARGINSNSHNNNGSHESNLNFTMSSSSSGFHRGTLQSNSSSSFLLPHLQRFHPIDGPPSIFIGTTAPGENHHQQFLSGFDARLQLYYGGVYGNNDSRQSDQKGNEKN